MNRTAQKRLKAEMSGATRAELRRVRRGRVKSAASGSGHGQRTVVHLSKRKTRAQRSREQAAVVLREGGVMERVFGPRP